MRDSRTEVVTRVFSSSGIVGGRFILWRKGSGMQILKVPLGRRRYDILIERGILDRLWNLLKEMISDGEKLVLIMDENIHALYGKRIRESLRPVLPRLEEVVVPAGESSKSMARLSWLFQRFAEAGLSRQGLIVAFGGGVVGDLAGFAAACWMRGIRFVQVPTTLLAQVDSSVGGKTAVDIPAGKNLVGAFHQPSKVIVDPALLETLPVRELRAGMAEVIKYGVIGSPSLFQTLAQGEPGEGVPQNIEDIIRTCCEIKRDVVVEDEREGGRRAILNFGHSIGHAVEACAGFGQILHGEAVAVGMCLAARLGESLGITEKKTVSEIVEMLARVGLPTGLPAEMNVDELIRWMRRDKKAAKGDLRMVFSRKIGETVLRQISFDRIAAFLSGTIAETDPLIRIAETGPHRGTEPETIAGATEQESIAAATEPESIAGAKVIDRFPAGVVGAPPSKSLSHRGLICAALSGDWEEMASFVRSGGDSEDIRATGACMEAILQNREGPVDCRESGSTMRFLMPIAGLSNREWVFMGRGRLLQRPMTPYQQAFARSGGYLVQEADRVRFRGPLRSGVFHLPGDVSSQFVTGLLLALPLVNGESEIRLSGRLESADYVKLTTATMARFGVGIQENRRFIEGREQTTGYRIRGGQKYRAAPFSIEGDYTQGANFLVAGALGCSVGVAGLNPDSLQGDRRILGLLKTMGASVIYEEGVHRVTSGRETLRAAAIDLSEIPDLAPPLAVLACYAAGTSRFYGGGRLRLKESDRIRALVTEMGKLGADIRETADGFLIEGKRTLSGGAADAWGDHRIAMAVAVAAIGCRRPVTLTGWQSVEKSYPRFWDDFEKMERI